MRFELSWTAVKKNICAVIFVSKTPDHIVLPPTSCLIQARLGLDIETLCYDSMAACYGFIGGMELAGLIAKQHDADVLLLTGDTNSRIVSAADSSAVMFGDGGAATIIGSVKDVSIDLHIRNNGAIADVATVKAGGFRYPTTEENLVFHTDQYGNSRNDCHMRMHGLDMMNFVLNDASALIKETMDFYGGAGAFDVIAFHQPNEMIVKSLAQCLSISLKKIPLYVNGYGNISSASIPLSLSKMLCEKNDKARCLTLMAGFGGGASWGTAVTDLSETEFYPVREVSKWTSREKLF